VHYKLLGFSQRGTLRVFSFERIQNSIPPVSFSVSADLSIARRYHLTLQELPGLCSRLLESGAEDQASAALSLSEEEMQKHALGTAKAAADIAAARALRSRRGVVPSDEDKQPEAVHIPLPDESA